MWRRSQRWSRCWSNRRVVPAGGAGLDDHSGRVPPGGGRPAAARSARVLPAAGSPHQRWSAPSPTRRLELESVGVPGQLRRVTRRGCGPWNLKRWRHTETTSTATRFASRRKLDSVRVIPNVREDREAPVPSIRLNTSVRPDATLLPRGCHIRWIQTGRDRTAWYSDAGAEPRRNTSKLPQVRDVPGSSPKWPRRVRLPAPPQSLIILPRASLGGPGWFAEVRRSLGSPV
jgi:hypothetical protein